MMTITASTATVRPNVSMVVTSLWGLSRPTRHGLAAKVQIWMILQDHPAKTGVEPGGVEPHGRACEYILGNPASGPTI